MRSATLENIICIYIMNRLILFLHYVKLCMVFATEQLAIYSVVVGCQSVVMWLMKYSEW